MKRVLATIISALVTLAFAGLAAAQTQPYATDTHPPIINEQPAEKGAPTKHVKKAKKKKKAKNAKKGADVETPGYAPNSTTPTAPPTTPQTPPPAQ